MTADEALDQYRDAVLAQAVVGWINEERQAEKRKATGEARALVKSMMVLQPRPALTPASSSTVTGIRLGKPASR